MSDRELLIDFLDSIRDYEKESHNLIGFDERESSEIVDHYLIEKDCENCEHTDDYYYQTCCECENYDKWKPQQTESKGRCCETCGSFQLLACLDCRNYDKWMKK